MIKVIFVGDVVGRGGRDILAQRVGWLKSSHQADFVVANGENAAAGAGITGKLARELLSTGLDGLTLGDHTWDQRGFDGEIGGIDKICRPANFPASNPGRDHLILRKNGFRLAVFTVLGRTFMGAQADCPFKAVDRMLAATVGAGEADAAFVEIHAEATSEKQALGWHLDGRAMAVIGTHTHVPTNDAEILPQGTAFMCDVGMTGPHASVLGREVEPVVARFIDGMPRRCEVATEDLRLSAVAVTYDPSAKRSTTIEPIFVRRS